jgi:hypothetical protein
MTDCVVGIVTAPRAGRYGVRVLARVRNFLVLSIIQAGSGAYTLFYLMDTGVLSRGLNTHLHLGPKSRLSGALPLFLIHAFLGWTGSNLTYFFTEVSVYRNFKSFYKDVCVYPVHP